MINLTNEFTFIDVNVDWFPLGMTRQSALDTENMRIRMYGANQHTKDQLYSIYPDSLFRTLTTIYGSTVSALSFRQQVETTEAIESRCKLRSRKVHQTTYRESCTTVNVKVHYPE